MSEDVRPFEEYKEMIKDMRKEEMIKGLYDLSKNITEKGKEIERLHNIIKEVREKIENTTINCDGVADDLIDDIYEILEKENK